MPEFDLVAPVYDTTRPPPTRAELDAVVGALDGDRTLLEAGVGTGRYALRLARRGLTVTGIDLAPAMLARARSKGLERLVRGDLRRLPFPSGAFDAALIVHVLQLLDEPFGAIAELARVVRDRVVAVYPELDPEAVRKRARFFARYREIARARGIRLPERMRYWGNGPRLVEAVAPRELRRVRVHETALSGARRVQALRSYGGLVAVPEAAHRAILRELRAAGGPAPVLGFGRTRTIVVASWGAEQRAALEARASRASPGPDRAGVTRRRRARST